jgi:DNA-binding SARP family transcriptional activator
VYFRLLGPLDVCVGDRVIEFGSARQRAILALLLLRRGRIVPMDDIYEALWDGDPPATAKGQVHTCISALRRELRQLGADGLLRTSAAGYSIRIPDESLDVADFERLASSGSASAASGHLTDAVRSFRAALQLWRGQAGANVECQIVQAMAARLNEDRIRVLEECIDAELALGQHHRLVVELSEQVSEHPLRERLRAQHMLALYRSGRQADALESFQMIRGMLSEELGLEPGDKLRTLQRAILAQDKTLDSGAGRAGQWTSPEAARAVVPRQLPAATADFVGRQDMLKVLLDLLSQSRSDTDRWVPVACLNGEGGVGKTALALHVAHAVRRHYPDGQLFVESRGADGQPADTMHVLARLISSLGGAPMTLPDQLPDRIAVYRSWLADKRVLIVLDDISSAAKAAALIPGNPECGVIITSRRPLADLPGARHFRVDKLSEAACLEMLGNIIGIERAAAEPAGGRQLVRFCDYLPLAVRIVAAKMATRQHWRIADLVQRMTDESRRLDELALGGVGMRATLATSYSGLREEPRRLFARLSLLGTTDFESWVSAPLLDEEIDHARDVLDELVEAGLLQARADSANVPRFRLHDLVRIYALERLASEETAADRAAALRSLLCCWLTLAIDAHHRAYDGGYGLHGSAPRWELPQQVRDALLDNPLSWFRRERAGLILAVTEAAQTGMDEVCWDLAVTMVTLFESDYLVDDWRKTHEVALDATRRSANTRGEAALLLSLGNLALTDELSEATRYLQPALAIFTQLNDLHGRALALSALAFADRVRGHCGQALARYRQALADFRRCGECIGEIDALGSIAQIEMDWSHFDEARRLLNEASALCRTLSAPRATAQIEHRLAELYLRTGAWPAAEHSFRSALAMVRNEGDLVGEAYALAGLGALHTRTGQLSLAEADLSAAFGLTKQMPGNLAHGRVLLSLADLHLAKSDHRSASPLISEGLLIFSETRSALVMRARLLETRARIEELAGNPSAASIARREALGMLGDADPALFAALTEALHPTTFPPDSAGHPGLTSSRQAYRVAADVAPGPRVTTRRSSRRAPPSGGKFNRLAMSGRCRACCLSSPLLGFQS